METTIPRLVQGAAERVGALSALEEGEITFDFRGLAHAGLEAARAFLAAGLQPGDRVGVWAPNIHEWVVAAIGLQSAGGVLVTLNTRMKGGEAAYILRKSGAKFLCTLGDFLGVDYVAAIAGEDLPDLEKVIALRGTPSGAVPWAEFMAGGQSIEPGEAQARLEAVQPEDLSDLIFTSGTTGQPKGVMTAHGQNIRGFEAWSEVVGLAEGDRYLIINPFFHSFGYMILWFSANESIGCVSLPNPVDAELIGQKVQQYRISMLLSTPTFLQLYLRRCTAAVSYTHLTLPTNREV